MLDGLRILAAQAQRFISWNRLWQIKRAREEVSLKYEFEPIHGTFFLPSRNCEELFSDCPKER